ncbi:MAG: MarR family transcriptional regulator [Lachnospiraceae bacterium]|nr:MarR family transcriptional regulator [Lachnospiraceae bacterium]
MKKTDKYWQPLNEQLGFALYVCSKEIIKSYKPHLDPYNLTYTQYIAMQVLWENEIISFKDMGNILHLDSGTLTPLIKRLEKRGLLRRVTNSEDERSIDIELLPAGKELYDKLPPLTERIMENCNSTFDETNTLRDQLWALLEKIHRN